MTASMLVGLAALPIIFFFTSYLSAQRLQVFQLLFNALGILSLCLFFAQAAVEIPAFAVPLAYLYYASIALFLIYMFLELLALIVNSLTVMLSGTKQMKINPLRRS